MSQTKSVLLKLRSYFPYLVVGFIVGWVASISRYGLAFGIPQRPPAGPPLSQTILEKAGLSAAQIEDVMKIQREEGPRVRGLTEEVEGARRELEKALEITHDENLLRERFQALAAKRAERDSAHFEVGLKIFSKMTHEQFTKLHQSGGLRPPPPH